MGSYEKMKTKEDEWIRTNIRISKFVFDKTVNYYVNLSRFLDIKIREYLYMIEQTSVTPNIHPHPSSCTQDSRPSKKSTDGKTTDLYRLSSN